MDSKRFSTRTIKLLITLRDGGEIAEGEIRSRDIRDLMHYLINHEAVSVKRQRSRLRYSAPNREKLLFHLADYTSILRDLDAALALAEGENMSREDKVDHFGDSKAGGEDSSETGFSIISTAPVFVRNHGWTHRIDAASALLVCDSGERLILPDGWTVVVVENSRLFFRHDWLTKVGIDKETAKKCFIIKRYPITAEQIKFLKTCPLPVRYFGDLDLGGVRIFETEYRRKVGEKLHFILPPDAEKRISGPKGNRKLYRDQMEHGLSNVDSPSGELTGLLRIIHKHQSCYEQEGYIYDA